jgi:hypothetical protein
MMTIFMAAVCCLPSSRQLRAQPNLPSALLDEFAVSYELAFEPLGEVGSRNRHRNQNLQRAIPQVHATAWHRPPVHNTFEVLPPERHDSATKNPFVRSHQLCPAQQQIGQRLVVNSFTMFFILQIVYYRGSQVECWTFMPHPRSSEIFV